MSLSRSMLLPEKQQKCFQCRNFQESGFGMSRREYSCSFKRHCSSFLTKCFAVNLRFLDLQSSHAKRILPLPKNRAFIRFILLVLVKKEQNHSTNVKFTSKVALFWVKTMNGSTHTVKRKSRWIR